MLLSILYCNFFLKFFMRLVYFMLLNVIYLYGKNCFMGSYLLMFLED